jgi:hypothetical protein
MACMRCRRRLEANDSRISCAAFGCACAAVGQRTGEHFFCFSTKKSPQTWDPKNKNMALWCIALLALAHAAAAFQLPAVCLRVRFVSPIRARPRPALAGLTASAPISSGDR